MILVFYFKNVLNASVALFVNEGFALDKEAMEVLRAKIMAMLIDELPIKENRSKLKD